MTARIPVIVGPTASGKTELGIQLAEHVNGEVISADSRQIYRHMSIGTAKPTPEEQEQAPHHLIDVVNPDEVFSANQFAKAASELIEDILERDRVPIVVGGSGFYVEALFQGLSPIPGVPKDVREAVAERVREDPESAFEELGHVDPDTAGRISPSDFQRLSRALEVYGQTGRPISFFQAQSRVPRTAAQSAFFALSWDRERLYERINLRAQRMWEGGLLEETTELYDLGYTRETYALNTFGYREAGAVLAGDMTTEEALEAIRLATRHYAKRQVTWFRNRCNAEWMDAESTKLVESVLASLEA